MADRSLDSSYMTLKHVFLYVFAWVLAVGVVVQLILVPNFPALDGGNGLLKGTDSVWFHEMAVELVISLYENGWDAFSLRPHENSPIALAALLYFTTGVNSPLLVLLFNGLFFATTATVAYDAFAQLSHTAAKFAILPLVLFASAAMIYSQIHKDIASVLSLAIAWRIAVALASSRDFSYRTVLLLWLCAGFSSLIAWLSRPYLGLLVFFCLIPVFAVLVSVFSRHRRPSWWLALIGIFFIFGLLASIYSSQKNSTFAFHHGMINNQISTPMARDQLCSTFNVGPISEYVSHIAFIRKGFNQNPGASSIDTHINFVTICDLIQYLPRALQIGLLAPFPYMWFSDVQTKSGYVMRVISSIEMSISYILLLGLVFGLIPREIKNPIFWISIIFSVSLLIFFPLLITNVGTLYRMRYFNWQIINGLGVIGWYYIFNKLFNAVIFNKRRNYA